jgi:hypothetical protein
MNITDQELADVLIARLNKLIVNSDVRRDLGAMIDHRTAVRPGTTVHPTIQVVDDGLSYLGILNGLTGIIADGPSKGRGYITAVCENDGTLLRFERTAER